MFGVYSVAVYVKVPLNFGLVQTTSCMENIIKFSFNQSNSLWYMTLILNFKTDSKPSTATKYPISNCSEASKKCRPGGFDAHAVKDCSPEPF